MSVIEIDKQVESLLNFKNAPTIKTNNLSSIKIQKNFIGLDYLRKIKHIYVHEGLKTLIIKSCKKYCPKKFKNKLKNIYLRNTNESAQILLTDNSIDQVLFTPEVIQGKNINVSFITKNSIVISIGLDWDNSNYPLLYWLKKRIGFTFVGAFYDGIPVENPELVQSFYFSQKFFSHLYYLVHLSDKIFCISEFSKKQLESICKEHHIEDAPQLKTIHLGDSVYKTATTKSVTNRAHKKEYVLYVSTVESRKNHILLLKVWQKLQTMNIDNLPDLILVGMSGWGIEDLNILYNNNKNLQKNVHFYDDVDDEELVSIYKNSKFTVFPSFVEGWGLGAVESMLYGKVCVISTCDALQEATQGLMPSLAPDDIDAWVNMILELVTDQSIIDKYTKDIEEKFQTRSWEKFSSDFTSFAKGQ